MASMLRHDSSAGWACASIRLRWMPLLQKSGPPASTMTRVGRALAARSAAVSAWHCAVPMAPLWKAKCSQPTAPVSS